jgi:hypothetical protein
MPDHLDPLIRTLTFTQSITMKKETLKLSLKKETIANLSNMTAGSAHNADITAAIGCTSFVPSDCTCDTEESVIVCPPEFA